MTNFIKYLTGFFDPLAKQRAAGLKAIDALVIEHQNQQRLDAIIATQWKEVNIEWYAQKGEQFPRLVEQEVFINAAMYNITKKYAPKQQVASPLTSDSTIDNAMERLVDGCLNAGMTTDEITSFLFKYSGISHTQTDYIKTWTTIYAMNAIGATTIAQPRYAS